MLTLHKFHNLGTPNIFFYLINEINKRGKGLGLSEAEIKQITYNKIIDERSIYDGCLPLAIEIGILTDIKGRFFVTNDFIKFLNKKEKLCDEIAKRIIQKLINEEEFVLIFSKNVFSYDITYKHTILAKNAFSLKYVNYKQLLIDFNILSLKSEIPKGYVINKRYLLFFQNLHLSISSKRRNISIKEFKENLENKERYGIEAENFVISFEEKRLNKKVEWLSKYVVNAGFDIVSYDNEEDITHNRFIEVKSFAGNPPTFYWSKNEIKEAKRRMKTYWIYLVDRNKISEKNYKPVMINNPFIKVFNNNEWIKTIENYKLSFNGATDI